MKPLAVEVEVHILECKVGKVGEQRHTRKILRSLQIKARRRRLTVRRQVGHV